MATKLNPQITGDRGSRLQTKIALFIWQLIFIGLSIWATVWLFTAPNSAYLSHHLGLSPEDCDIPLKATALIGIVVCIAEMVTIASENRMFNLFFAIFNCIAFIGYIVFALILGHRLTLYACILFTLSYTGLTTIFLVQLDAKVQVVRANPNIVGGGLNIG